MDDRLSALSDDLLRHILHFVPSKEAASTSVLSRRWGSLWRSSGAVNLAVRVHGYERYGYGHDAESIKRRKKAEDAFFSTQEAFDRAAAAALAAAEAPVTRLTLRVDSDELNSAVDQFLGRRRGWAADADVVGAVLRHRAASRVEDLRVALGGGGFPDVREPERSSGIYSVASLPASGTLRVLDLTRCNLAPSSVDAAAFPRLATLRLRLCSVQTKGLQALLDAAPELATVRLESVLFTRPRKSRNSTPYFHVYQYQYQEEDDGTTAAEQPVVQLSFPAATMLVLALCGLENCPAGNGWAIEIDAPKLRSLEYKGLLRRFLLRSPAPDLARVDLHLLHGRGASNDHDGRAQRARCVLFWQFVHNFTNVRALKLKVDYDLKDIAALGTERRAKLLCAFPEAESLELEAVHRPTSKTAAVAIANLLQCCPVLRDFRLMLSTMSSQEQKRSSYGRPFLSRKDRLDYSKSIERFTHRSNKTMMISMEDSSVERFDDIADIPGLSGHSFACLESCLRRVSLQFRLGDSGTSCLGVRLVKFFADNAMVLEEMCVDSGNRRLHEHLNLSVERWVASNSTKVCFEHKNVAEGSWEFSKIPSVSLDSTTDFGRTKAGFTVLPLQRETRI